MKLFVITLFAAAFLSVDASPKPGGYTLKGGVDHRYMHEKPEGYYRSAQQAGKYTCICTISLPSIIIYLFRNIIIEFF